MTTQKEEIKKLVEEEKVLIKEEKKVERNIWISTGLIGFLILCVAGGLIYYRINHNRITIDNSNIVAQEIDLAPQGSGILEQVYVHEGDTIPANTPVAQVGTEVITSKVAGEVITVQNNIGKLISPGEAVVTMIDPTTLRVVGQIDEDKGLSSIAVGDPVTFTVDAFGSKQFAGVVDEISPTSNQSGIVFNISDTREVQQFDIKARFDVNQYTGLKNGMSARMYVYVQ